MPTLDDGQALERWQTLYREDIDVAISRRDLAVARLTQPIVSHDDLVEWISGSREILKPLSKHW